MLIKSTMTFSQTEFEDIRETSGTMDNAKPKDSHLLKVPAEGGDHLWCSTDQ